MADSEKTFGFLSKLFDNKLFDAQLERMNAWMEQMEELQKQNIDRSAEAMEEMAELGKETLNYAEDLSRQWVELNLETFRSATNRGDEN